MLILIYGITGMCGQECARAAFKENHKVRGLARNPDKLDKDIAERLDGFVQMKDIYDMAALEEAVKGVDAIISAAHYTPEVVVDGQILLLRAAERAGVKIFHAASWNYDWTKVKLGDCESYDSYLSFWNHARISSTIKPIYGFTGVILEYLFYYSPHSNPLDKKNGTMSFFGTGNEVWTCISVKNLAEYTIKAISEPNAVDGGFYYVDSFRCTLRELAAAYEESRHVKLELKSLGTVEDVDRLLEKARAEIPAHRYLEYVGFSYMKVSLRGIWDYDSIDNKRWSDVKRVGFKDWLEQNPEI